MLASVDTDLKACLAKAESLNKTLKVSSKKLANFNATAAGQNERSTTSDAGMVLLKRRRDQVDASAAA